MRSSFAKLLWQRLYPGRQVSSLLHWPELASSKDSTPESEEACYLFYKPGPKRGSCPVWGGHSCPPMSGSPLTRLPRSLRVLCARSGKQRHDLWESQHVCVQGI